MFSIAAIHPSVRLSLCPIAVAQQRLILGLKSKYRTLIGSHMLEVCGSGRAATESGRNCNKAVAGAASEAFAR